MYEFGFGYVTYIHPVFWFCIGFLGGGGLFMLTFCTITGRYISRIKSKLFTEYKESASTGVLDKY